MNGTIDARVVKTNYINYFTCTQGDESQEWHTGLLRRFIE